MARKSRISTDHFADQAATAVASLKRLANKRYREEMSSRYGIITDKAFGVPVGKIQQVGKRLGRNHDLAKALWKAGWYEARMLAGFIDEPARVTPRQMDGWCRDFDNWGICDTVCFHLFDKTPHAFAMIRKWSSRRAEFEKRAAFALLASLALHDKTSDDEPFVACLSLIERAADDERNFVKKGVSWALRGIGRRNAKLRASAVSLAKRLCKSDEQAARWIGRDALRDLSRPMAGRRGK